MLKLIFAFVLISYASKVKAKDNIDYGSHVVKLSASSCQSTSGTNRQSGFFIKYNSTIYIVTTLHGVCGCTNIKAQNYHGKIFEGLKISRIDLKNDLVLLSSQNLTGLPMQQGSFNDSSIKGKKVEVIGYAYTILKTIKRHPVVDGSVPISSLSSSVDANARNGLKERNSPSLSINVIRFTGGDGTLPGLSGAPIIFQDQVIGVVSGGLKSGNIDLGWGIPLSGVQFKSISEFNNEEKRLYENLKKKNSRSLFATASKERYVEYRSMIEEMGIEYNRDEFIQVVKENDTQVVKLFLEAGIRPNVRERENDRSVLMIAAELGYSNLVEMLLLAGADIHHQNNSLQQNTPIMYASASGSVECVRVMYEYDNTIMDNRKGIKAIEWAAARDKSEVISYLIDIGVNIKGDNAGKALHFACVYGYLEPIKILHRNGANLNAKVFSGITALMKAADRGHYNTVELLLKLGADKNIISEEGFTALSLARNRNETEIVKLIERY